MGLVEGKIVAHATMDPPDAHDEPQREPDPHVAGNSKNKPNLCSRVAISFSCQRELGSSNSHFGPIAGVHPRFGRREARGTGLDLARSG